MNGIVKMKMENKAASFPIVPLPTLAIKIVNNERLTPGTLTWEVTGAGYAQLEPGRKGAALPGTASELLLSTGA